jgi:hypothetical protein
MKFFFVTCNERVAGAPVRPAQWRRQEGVGMARTRGTATAGAQPSVEARGQSEEQVVAARNGEETRGEVGGVHVRVEGGTGYMGLWQ